MQLEETGDIDARRNINGDGEGRFNPALTTADAQSGGHGPPIQFHVTITGVILVVAHLSHPTVSRFDN